MDAFDKLIPFLSGSLESKAILVGSHERIPLKQEAFQQIQPIIGHKFVFVDAGNGEVLRGPHVTLQFLRLYSTWYDNNVRVDRDVREYFLTVVACQKDLDLAFEATLFDIDGNKLQTFSFDAFDPVLCFGGRRADPVAVCNHVRKLLELQLCKELCENLEKGDVVVRDGDLEGRGQIMTDLVRSLRSSAQNKGVIVIGLSKTSTLCTDTGNSALSALRSFAPPGAWSYFAGSSIAFVKLHPASKYIFRCDVFPHDRALLSSVWASLAANSSDPAFLGYPYGLIDADKFAQVPRNEVEQLRARFEKNLKYRVYNPTT